MNAEALWLIVASTLVLSMQIGFLLLEGGRVRAKNSISVAQKNISDLIVSWVCFSLIGFQIMFGVGVSSPESGGASPLQFVFQLGFCATAASIVSGGIAERMRFVNYLMMAAVMAAVIYPIAGWWVWGDLFSAERTAWLAELGFIDFAGATVVHVTGAGAALVGIVMLGPRLGRFDDNGNPLPMASHSSIMSLQGTLILLVGWIGFNGGGLALSDPLLQPVIMNTLTTAAFGAFAGVILGVSLDRGIFNPGRTINGLIGGLVAGTACVHLLNQYQAMVVGVLGGVAAVGAAEWFLTRLKLDDPVDVVATHGVAGVVGTLSVALFAPAGLLVGGSRLMQFGVQLFGIVVVLGLVVAVTWASLRLIGTVFPLRVSREQEELGLNHTEHGTAVDTDRLRLALQERAHSESAFGGGIDLDRDDEQHELAQTINALVERHEDARREVVLSEERFKHFANTASDWLWESDPSLRFSSITVSESVRENFCDLEGWTGKCLTDIARLSDDTRLRLQHALASGIRFGPLDGIVGASSQTGQTGAELFIEIRGAPVHDTDGTLLGYRGTISNVTSRKQAERRAVHLALHDTLTGLKNRRALNRELPSLLGVATEKKHAVGVLALDLDGFKAVNDSYGHGAGDVLLRLVARRMENVLKHRGQVFRTGGDEMVVVLDALPMDSAPATVELIVTSVIDSVSNPFEIDGLSVTIGVSAGGCLYPMSSVKPDELLRKSDLALYAAKEDGKGRFMWFDENMDGEFENRLSMEVEVKRAIANSELYLHYQPLYDAETEQLRAFEALIRWNHPVRGELPPGEFICKAEKNGMMTLIGDFVLDKACAFARQLRNAGDKADCRVAVNVSPSHFQDESFVANVEACLAKHDIDGRSLEIELTEDILIQNHVAVLDHIYSLERLGVTISIDDFGSGQTSLRYLSKFPVKTLKIDRTFTQGIEFDPRAAEITRSVIDMGSRLGYSVVAEGVESMEQLGILKEWKCPVVQGFLFSKPVSEAEALALPPRTNDAIEMKKAG